MCFLISHECVRVLGTFVAEVVDQDDLGYELRGGAVEHAVNSPQQRRPALVMERDDDAGVGQLLCVQLLFTAAHRGNKCRNLLKTCVVAILRICSCFPTSALLREGRKHLIYIPHPAIFLLVTHSPPQHISGHRVDIWIRCSNGCV